VEDKRKETNTTSYKDLTGHIFEKRKSGKFKQIVKSAVVGASGVFGSGVLSNLKGGDAFGNSSMLALASIGSMVGVGYFLKQQDKKISYTEQDLRNICFEPEDLDAGDLQIISKLKITVQRVLYNERVLALVSIDSASFSEEAFVKKVLNLL
jgi:hypothetical protein